MEKKLKENADLGNEEQVICLYKSLLGSRMTSEINLQVVEKVVELTSGNQSQVMNVLSDFLAEESEKKGKRLAQFKKDSLHPFKEGLSPDQGAVFQFLEDTELIDRLALHVLNQRVPRLNLLKQTLFEVLTNALGPNFLSDNIEEICSRKRAARGLDKAIDRLVIKGHLFHATGDAALLKIIKNGFKRSTEVSLQGAGTGDFEKHIGANGIFACYEYLYKRADTGGQIVVLPIDLLKDPKSICISGEISFDLIWEVILTKGEAKRFGLKHSLADICNTTTFFSNEEKQKFYFQHLVGAVLEAFSRLIILPEDIFSDPYRFEHEIAIPPENIDLPVMIVVDEEPEYFLEEALAHNNDIYEGVPIVSIEKVLDAVNTSKSLNLGEEDIEEALKIFLEDTKTGDIDIEAYRCRLQSSLLLNTEG